MVFKKTGKGAERGKITVYLTSPSGTRSTLLRERPLDDVSLGYEKWPLMSLHFWGEDPEGEWTITVVNNNKARRRPKNAVVVIRSVQFYGVDTIPEAVSRIPAQCSEECDPTRGCADVGAEYCDVCAEFRVKSSLECVSACPEGQIARRKYCYDPTTPEPACEAEMP